ncbi:GNAT family N-acetyltransferase [Sulfurimonas sp. HSL1-2]|uniref:GNAT family N-acetyltransferase n=1 Tax=Thiomicrolovo zhangzhouensis TaxID=3131933 RepID=UPI0031F735BA
MSEPQWETLRTWLMAQRAIAPEVKVPAEVKRLDLSNRALQSLPESFGLLSELVALNLGNNKLAALPESMASMTKLGNVDLRRNAFTAVPALLGALPIRSLNLSGNRISDVCELVRFTMLRVLDLSGNVLERFDNCLSVPNELRTLNLAGNYIKDIAAMLAQLTSVERLNLEGNLITSIPPEAAYLSSLLELELSDNRIETIDKAFFTLGVESVNLASNRIKEVTLHGLDELEVMTLDDNALSSLQIADDFAPYLRAFSCDGCGLTAFPMLPSTTLGSLCFSSNAISDVPETISRYTELYELDIDGNAIVDLPEELANMKSLKSLYIGDNPLNEHAKLVIEVLHPEICDINMKTGITIEAATEEDLPHMAELLGVLFAIEQDFEIDFDKQLSGITKLYGHEGTDLLVARHEGKVVGMLTMQRLISSAEGDYVGQIEDLVVLQEYRKMGVGSRLINKMRFMAQSYGYKRIQLAADIDNENAHNFYTRRGFRRTNLTVFHFKNNF